ncbi:MAG: HD domain-containing protein [Cyanobacteria bacterium J06626_18]
MTEDSFASVLNALQFAAWKHRQQRRKDAEATPYINHPIGLLHLLFREGQVTDPIVLMGALLHDTVEDTDTTVAEIRAHFGESVATVVAQVTDDKSLPKTTRKRLQIEHAVTLCDRAKLVKLADKIHNLRDLAQSPPADWPPERLRSYCDWCKQVIDQLRGIHPPLEVLFDQAYDAAYAAYPPHTVKS